MKPRSVLRLEWISLVYLALFVLAVLSPSLVSHGFFGIDESHIEEAMIFLFGIVGLATFSIYQRLMERKEKEHEDAKTEYERAKRELVESYRYIGAINRQIEVLKRVTNQTSMNILAKDHLTKDLLTSLLANAAAAVGSKMALIRYVELDKLRTHHEVLHSLEKGQTFKIHNRDLKKLHDSGAAHAYLRSDDGQEVLVVPSDHENAPIKAYLLVLPQSTQTTSSDTSLLKVFANQAQLLHHTLEEQLKVNQAPMELLEAAKGQVVGEVE
ncbi:MAG: hypothetical protein ABIO72_05750 [Patescibacteria group bacterium]